MRVGKIIGRLPAIMLAASAPATAAVPASQAVATETLTIPFAPPLDRELAYRLTLPKSRDGKARSVHQVLRFSRNGDGFILTISPKRLMVDAVSIDLTKDAKLLPPSVRPLFEPVSYDVDSAGEVLRIRNWPAILKDLKASLGVLSLSLEPDPAKRKSMLEGTQAAYDVFARMAPEQAAAHYLQGWQAVLGFGGTEFIEGQEEQGEGEAVSGFTTPVPITGVSTVTRPRPGVLRLIQNQKMDREKAAAAIGVFIEQITRNAPADSAANRRLQAVATQMREADFTDVLEIDFDATTGLPIKAMSRRTITMPNEPPAVKTTIIERM